MSLYLYYYRWQSLTFEDWSMGIGRKVDGRMAFIFTAIPWENKFPFWKKKDLSWWVCQISISLKSAWRFETQFFFICLVKFPVVEESLRWLTWSLLFSFYINTENPEINCSTCDYLCIQRKILKSYIHQTKPFWICVNYLHKISSL